MPGPPMHATALDAPGSAFCCVPVHLNSVLRARPARVGPDLPALWSGVRFGRHHRAVSSALALGDQADALWQRYGTATTAFDLARYPALGSQFLENRPDLLLFQPTSDIGSDADPNTPILICEEGIVYRNIVIRDPEIAMTVKEKPEHVGEGFDLIIGKQRINFLDDPTMTAKRLQVWVKFLFRDFLPGSAAVKGRRSPGKLKNLLWQKTVLCPECEHPFLALRGEVGIITDTSMK